jgi:hypothetical protein
MIHDLGLAIAEQPERSEVRSIGCPVEADTEQLPREIWLIIAIVVGSYANAILYLLGY